MTILSKGTNKITVADENLLQLYIRNGYKIDGAKEPVVEQNKPKANVPDVVIENETQEPVKEIVKEFVAPNRKDVVKMDEEQLLNVLEEMEIAPKKDATVKELQGQVLSAL